MAPEQAKVLQNCLPGEGGCFVWQLSKNDGYGAFKILGKSFRAHRVALEMKLGRAISQGMQALHSCDNRACCNPSHLREGTHKQNMRDKAIRKRVNVRGVKNPRAKLSEIQILEIRRAYALGTASQVALGKSHGVSQRAISKIVLRQSWSEF